MVEAVKSQSAAEYEAVRGGGAGLFDLSARGRVEVSGGEAVIFLNGMLTNDVAKLEEGAWMHAALPNPQGRLLASVRVLRREGAFLFDTEAETYPTVLKHLERFTLAGDFHVRDLTQETTLLSVQGARAADIVTAATGEDVHGLARGRAAYVGDGRVGRPPAVIRATHTAEDGFDIFVGADEASPLRQSLLDAGAKPCGIDTLEVLRVEAGIPRYGLDASDANVVLEVVDEAEAVSYTKGCYAGQEIIARIHWRGHVAKRLAGVIFERDAEPPADARLRAGDEGREAGRITSSVYSPRLQRRVALAVVKYDFLAPGTELKVFSEGGEVCGAHVAPLPLVRGGWYAQAEGEGDSE
ncbi:MAG: aminomethyltransferase family protein [Acidobacteria bacterium]|nr:aminomethyltransferase family protein [Acidobacteriota bacterium]